MKIIFLDDERNPEDVFWINYPKNITDIYIVRTYKEFVKAVNEYLHKDSIEDILFSFDHDIQDFNSDGYENTGKTCAIYLVEYMLNNPELDEVKDKLSFIIHSQNPIGKQNIESYINNYKSV